MGKYKSLSDAYTMVQIFKDFWAIENIEDEKVYLAFWCNLVENTKMVSFIKASKTIKNY
jgi:hypothetical protein